MIPLLFLICDWLTIIQDPGLGRLRPHGHARAGPRRASGQPGPDTVGTHQRLPGDGVRVRIRGRRDQGRFNGATIFQPWKFVDSRPEGDEPIPLQ